MNWEFFLIVGAIILAFGLVMFLAIKESIAEEKRIEENTFKLMTREQVREFLAEKLEIKPSQVRFRIENGQFCGIRMMKYVEE